MGWGGLTEREEAIIPPRPQVEGAFEADAVVRRMQHDILVAQGQDADVLPGLRPACIGPVHQIVGIRHAHAVLLEEAPPLPRLVFVFKEVRINHPPHPFARHVRPFDAQQFRLRPCFQVGAPHQPQPRVTVPILFPVRTWVGLEAKHPLPPKSGDDARAAEVQGAVGGRQRLRRRPLPQVAAPARPQERVHEAIRRRLYQREEEVPDAIAA